MPQPQRRLAWPDSLYTVSTQKDSSNVHCGLLQNQRNLFRKVNTCEQSVPAQPSLGA